MERNHGIDTLRSVATLLVVLLHIAATYVSKSKATHTFDADFWVSNVLDAYSRICVPLFVMISGMFLLGRSEPIGEQYRKRAVRILLPLVVWSLLYLQYQRWIGHLTGFRPDNNYLLEQLLAGNPFYHLWYLFMVTGLYLTAPFINWFVARVSRARLWFTACVLMGIGMIRSAYTSYHELEPFFLTWCVDYFGYFLFGYILSTSKTTWSAKVQFGIYLVSGGLIAALTSYTILHYNNLYFYGYLTPLVILGALCFFSAFQQLNLRKNILTRLAPFSFGIYLVHAGILDVLNNLIRMQYLQLSSMAVIDIPIKCLIVLVISLAIVYPMSKIRLFKQLI
ncbi:MAG: acyltransferase [Bacteroidota bacterium]